MANVKGRLVRASRLEGTAEICRELGVTRAMLWKVRKGQSVSARVQKALEARNIHVKAPRRRGRAQA
jgi:hypothetical protein